MKQLLLCCRVDDGHVLWRQRFSSHRGRAGIEDSTSKSQGLDNAAGAEISPQLASDSADVSRFEIDTVFSARGAERQSRDDALEDKR
jgi:hypothetical protein